MDRQDLIAAMNSTGLMTGDGGMNWWNIAGGVIFGTVGLIAFLYGKKSKSVRPLAIGLVLMIYPYFVPNAVALYAVGIGLSVLLFMWRE